MITNVSKDPKALTMTVDAEFDAPVERVWQLYADPRQLERFWGPPTYPATVVDHDLTPGGRVNYFMTGPGGDRSTGYWKIIKAEAPKLLEFEDGFADENFTPNEKMPQMNIRVELSERAGGGTKMFVCTTFPSKAAMEQLLTMGMEEGMREAMGQMDAVLADAQTGRR
jgi:uncharacterized protein YndB with AHSA1/START domain